MKKKMPVFIVMLLLAVFLTTVLPVTASAASKTTPGKVSLTKISSSAYNKVTVSWDKASNATGYAVYYREYGTSGWKKIASVDAARTSYTHTSSKKYPIVIGKKYNYTVKAYNKNSGKYGSFNIIGLKISTLPDKVKLKSAVLDNSGSSVTISWEKSKGCDSYVVFRKSVPSGWRQIAVVDAGKQSYRDKNPVTEADNFYTVRGYYSKTKTYGRCDTAGKNVYVKEQMKYTYEMIVLTKYNLYDMQEVPIFIKTDNPDIEDVGITAGASCCYRKHHYQDIHYVDDPNEQNKPPSNIVHLVDVEKVNGGYIYYAMFQHPGKNSVLVYEDSRPKAKTLEFELYINDSKKAEEEWYQKTLERETNDSMTKKEKMEALSRYVRSNFKYLTCDLAQNKIVYFAALQGAWFETYRIDCLDTTRIMMKFADMLGLKSESTFSGSKNHHYATVYFEDGPCGFDPSPSSSSGVISNINYIL